MRGRLRDVLPMGQKCVVSLELDTQAASIEKYAEKPIEVKLSHIRKRRSVDANAMLWACLGEIAAALRADKWDIYLQMLKRYGRYTYILIRPEALDDMRKTWRECEIVGQGTLPNGDVMVQLLCYFGSSTYDSREFSVLLSGVISEMREMGLEPPPTQEMKAAIEEMERHENGAKN